MLSIRSVRCEYKHNPLGIDVLQPRLAWQLLSTRQNTQQIAYRIVVAASEKDLEEEHYVWDSHKVSSDSLSAIYSGPALENRKRYFYALKAWDNHGEESAWSESAWWEMAFLDPREWQAKFIKSTRPLAKKETRTAEYLRTSFVINQPIKRARLYISAHGLFQAHINGRRVGDEYFAPGWTNYVKTLQYQIYDVGHLLQQGDNALGAILGDGWYRGYISYINMCNAYGDELALLAQLEIELADGSRQVVASNSEWLCDEGEIRANDLFNGEVIDARLAQKKWSCAEFVAKKWRHCLEVDADYNRLVAPISPPVKKIQILKAISVIKTPAGETVFDFGQNITGWVQLKAQAAKGTTVILTFAEVLDKEGNFYTKNLRMAKSTDTFIFSGEGEESFEPSFSYHGFRYVKIEGWPTDAAQDLLIAHVVHSDLSITGNFSCSDERVNQLFKNIIWTQRDNFLDIPSDCPQRDERMGWTADIQVFTPTACFTT